MKNITIPSNYNYIAAFLTFACNYRCSYCINYFSGKNFANKIISGNDWVKALNRINSREDLPVTLQGGEPSLHKDFIYIINNIKPTLHIDILTNLQFDVDEFSDKVDSDRLKRDAPYASIRVSYHPAVMNLNDTVLKVKRLLALGFSVGVWGVLHPEQKDEIISAQVACLSEGIDFRTKEFLGEYNGQLYGTYKYVGSCSKKSKKQCLCKTTELIVGPGAAVYRCHADLYENRQPIGNLLDENFKIEDIPRRCNFFGHCNPCDVKVKTNRFQEFGHTSVNIEQISD
ncbi:MAG: 4Fe-4S cluster-binding domain-containing protein [Candidatus Omnitrophica bacterium]|nr:4Fe-4S cluster-binding domain-containing protein [Candidatus Omnitrophota bacterium]